MRDVIYSMNISLDGYIVGPDGGFDWSGPEPEVFQHFTDEIREVDVHLLGRRLYETMRYWDDPDNAASFDEAERVWADLWNPLPKVVFSKTLTEVDDSARLATEGVAAEIDKLKVEPGEGLIAIGGATLAAQAAEHDLIDEYRVMVYPVLVGGGISYFPQHERHVDLELVESRVFGPNVVYHRHRVRR
ncbi:dihydrofolate reductase family protein [Cellulosimicrobium sp. CUA-896]|uniref:dihydrofolate reductase family protein n=1 Tax=Cellulosimicrobium sp. CUA-896 TaxID=1517881 RepID=UPI00095D931D|nr:dihydrofolate reductase family protein [Cellulosimicrobium sp. CUA-896]OLT52410.1 deaminase [Cellulosimicrobium sp. CUA-896]